MSQQEGSTDYKFEDYASEMAAYRLPQTAALIDAKLKITLDSGAAFDLEFTEYNKVLWKSGAEQDTDWCEAVQVAPNTYFIDMTLKQYPRQTQTFIINTETRQALSIRTLMREGDIGKDPRAVHHFTAGRTGDPSVPPSGRKPSPTRDLFGLRALYTYNPRQVFEHAYMNSERYAWHCVAGPLKGQADVEQCTTFKWDENQYVFCWREHGLPVSTVFFYNWDQMKSTGKFFAIGEKGAFANTPAGALISKLSMAFYPREAQPL